MTESEVNGAPASFDLAAAKQALAASSTVVRIAQLNTIEEGVKSNCTISPSLPCPAPIWLTCF
jgi:hypothetical protein